MNRRFDVVIFGNYTKDTIVSSAGTRYVDGGGFNYGAHAVAALGLKVAAVTRLAQSDSQIVENLEQAGIVVYPHFTSSSTHMRLEYPTDNPDERKLYCTNDAGSYTLDQFDGLDARAFLINASIRGEAPLEVIRELRHRAGMLVADVQGFLRIIAEDGLLVHAEWPEMSELLSLIDILKTDAKEAESLTGESNMYRATDILAGYGPKEVVLTHRHGILVRAEGRYHEAPFHVERLVGRSGRGDTCIASYAAKRLSAEPAEAVLWSAATTSLKMEAEGPIKRPLSDIERLVNEKYRQ
ncbi:MAG: PfkB family carbohydrate kinase [bacterium]